ncbi:acetyltransferase, GNAT family [gamma proteobacterium NOR5-3]|nr:acetyltransferase, GNAT family [gamma proteobacterium NOR5-3]
MTETADVLLREALWPQDASVLERLRSAVFVLEQGVPRDIEWDGRDAEARHMIAELNGTPIGCGRLLADGRIGRLAVLAQHRGQGIGAQLLSAIVGMARQRGEHSLYLHAQADAVQFYERAGFTVQGEPFEEAGIQHVSMHITLDYRDWDDPIARLRYPQPFTELVIAQARLARRELRILSPRLDTRVFDQDELESAIRVFLRGGRLCSVKILVQDARAVVQRGHRLLALSRRLPSRVEMRRLPEHPEWNGETLVMRDRGSLLEMPGSETDFGFYRPHDRPGSETAINRFEELWRLGQVDPEFRALAI